MDCARFENLLAEAIDGDREGLELLRSHAASCADCRASVPLVDLLELPVAERDALEPPDGYWDDLETRVRERLESEPRVAAPKVRVLWFAPAAALLLALVGGWLLWPKGTVGPPPIASSVTDPVDPVRAAPSDEPALADDEAAGWYASWEAGPLAEDEEALDEELAAGAGWSEGLFPDTGDLSPEDRRELVLWLKSQSS